MAQTEGIMAGMSSGGALCAALKLSKELEQNIFFVPRIYADELIKDNPSYLKDLSKTLNSHISIL